ncbi:hypothetical protein STRTUCAR8_00131 [Streptomyces turgidiscabies Car8]|uniref:Uncharacterized protein n=1 Tax=Streptomyces turgidiscabies (strain Car8) TaxID=698760 RepID=L7FB13_STRT8|nr:hypothetical protein STRTUCAR8_00131 [Streptomyces turgidiscabies Car8]
MAAVTGGSSGLGKASARRLAAHGNDIATKSRECGDGVRATVGKSPWIQARSDGSGLCRWWM